MIAEEPTSLTSSLDGIGLRPVAGPMEAHPARWETEGGVVLDILAPRRRGGEPAILHRGLGVWAQALAFLEFSLRRPIDAVVLGREGVPAPELMRSTSSSSPRRARARIGRSPRRT